MKSWQINRTNSIVFSETAAQPVGDNCVKIKLMYTTVSRTDRLIFAGKLPVELPIVPGRHGVGQVVETGENVKNFSRGDIVAVKPHSACGTCAKCQDGKFSECEKPLTFGVNEDGFMRDFAVVAASDIIKLPEKRIEPQHAIFLDIIDIAIETVDKLKLDKGDHLVIAGASQLGLVMTQVAMYYQIVPIVIDSNPNFLELAAKTGAYYTINSTETAAAKKVFALTGGKMADGAAYMTVSGFPFEQVCSYVKRGGGIAVCGMENTAPDINVPLAPLLNKRLSSFGICESNTNIAAAVNMLANKTINPEILIGREIDFSEIEKEFTEGVQEHIYQKILVRI